MRRAYHYTRPSNWREIQKSGFLEPRTKLVDPGLHIVLNLEVPAIPFLRFTFALLDTPEPDSWKESGQLEALLTNRIDTISVALISFPLNYEKTFVVDRTPILYVGRRILDRRTALKRYHESMVQMTDYRDNYAVPELLIAERISLERIRFEGTLKPNRPPQYF
ncbi:MAG: hypothetical protein AABX05_02105 [Nanoarchaeota archaeon]